MAEATEAPETPAAPQIFDMQALGNAIAEGISRSTRRKVTFGEYKSVSAQQPDKTKTVRLTRTCYQNGGVMDKTRLSNQEITLLNQVHRSGRYCNRIVEVVIGRDGSEDAVDFRYNNKSNDQKLEFKGQCRSLVDMLQQIVEEQAVLDEQDEERMTRPSADTSRRAPTSTGPTFGQSKATREAREKAGA